MDVAIEFEEFIVKDAPDIDKAKDRMLTLCPFIRIKKAYEVKPISMEEEHNKE